MGGPAEGPAAPAAFRRAVESLRAGALRPEVAAEVIRAPRRLAPFSFAVSGEVGAAEDGDGDERGDDGGPGIGTADGRLILLHDPDGQDAWRGEYRVVVLVQADLEPELASDPLLPDVGWSWLSEALAARGCAYAEPSGTVSRSSSHFFGGLAGRDPSTRIEIRASWTPLAAPQAPEGVPELGCHLAAWGELLCAAAGLPPVQEGVIAMPRPGRGR
ncbi:hypothetical protein BIV57_20815 [Mangrovactinospora gilvigrisea]|uniref:DUF3000 domain-containing protein n=2 Tax=Mangrovactinospora gilvigrisea TaxID=1428644 RepID=A0A1J7BAE6_9ACTN|nr:hypothetical protein BIV57_20815 [Mangrovactinospora gilvigrisea]